MELKYNAETGDIVDGANMILAYVGREARQSYPHLGSQLAAGPEACRLLERVLAALLPISAPCSQW
jgi:hypothetical protein